MEILKTADYPVANFAATTPKCSYQVELIVKLLIASVQDKKPITISDIQDIYAQYAMKASRHNTHWRVFYDKDGKRQCEYLKTLQEWREYYATASKARGWFKANLGAAILSGRILAIPVIEM